MNADKGMRLVLLIGLVGLLWLAVWGQQARPPERLYEHTFEASRRGATAVDSPGPFSHPDFLRLVLRRAGVFRFHLTRELREWRAAPPADFWAAETPEILKIRVTAESLEVVQQPARLRLGVHTLYNLPLVIRNDASQPVDVKVIGRLGDDGPTDRFDARAGVNYFSLNLRPRSRGVSSVALRIHAGMRLPEAGAPPESTLGREISIPVEVVGWGALRLKTTEPARVFLTGSDGLAYTPSNTLARLTWSGGEYFYYSRGGEDEIRLPEGRATIEAVRGFEYAPVTQTVEIREGQTASATLTLARRENLAREGWYSGDVHIHANYNNHEIITPEDVRDQAEAEDLNVANLMVANSGGPHIHDEQYFEGRPNRLSTPLHILYWVEEMRNNGPYGHMCLTGLKSLVKPLYTGFVNSPYPHDYPPNHAQALAANRQGGAASYAHPGYNFTADPQTMSAREMPVDLALGSINAMDVLSNSDEDAAAGLWYRLLNTGLRCAISAGTDSMTNRRQHWIAGGQRVYVNVPGKFDYDGWVAGYKAGRSFATNGPLLRFTVEGKGPGGEARLAGAGSVAIVAAATSVVPFETLEVVANGQVIATARAEGGGLSTRLSINTTHRLDRSAWLAARARGPYHRFLANDASVYAHTSPVYCLAGNDRIGLPADGQFFVEWIDKLIAMCEKRGRYASDEQKRDVVELFRKGRAYYEEVARR